ncbi:alpha/beta hydrolase [Tenacibaculum sp. 190524A05c]|uniref:alpha/beta fold hydrolase n=1 Tax=Tenacibaculum platacis TaxID=3137852 RepID=UPI0031FBA2D1
MKTIKTIIKKFFKYLGILFAIIIFSGLLFRMFGPNPNKPLGELIEVNGVNFHVHTTGKKSKKPTVIIEGGGGVSTEYFHWLSEGLKDSLRVFRYDRAGVGYSDLNTTPRNPETIAKELHELLEQSGESPPYIIAGHSLGGPYMRVFTELYPDEVKGLVFMDATHPEQVERFNAAPKDSFRFKSAVWGINVAIFFADVGVLGLLQSFTDPIFSAKGLPDELNERTKDFLMNGKSLRGYRNEINNYHSTLKRVQQPVDFGNMPIRVITAIGEQKIELNNHLKKVIAAHKEYTEWSSDGKQILIHGNHQTIFTIKKNADIICEEILKLTRNVILRF